MSCNLEHEHKSQESDSQVPESGDWGGGSSDHPIGHDHDAESVVPSRSQEISHSSNNPVPVSGGKGKRKLLEVEDSTESGKRDAGSVFTRKAHRKRLTFTQKMEILQLLDNNVKQVEIARRYGCSRRAVSDIAVKRAELEARKKAPGFNGEAKSDKSSDFPELEKNVVKMVQDARSYRIPVTREAISNFGRTAKKQMLSSKGLSESERKRLEKFSASLRWTDNFVRRQGLVRKAFHVEVDGVGREATRERDSVDGSVTSRKTPEELLSYLDHLDEYAKSASNLDIVHHVRGIRESLSRTIAELRNKSVTHVGN